MAEVDPYAVIEAFTNRVGHLNQELMVAQAYIASLESDVTKLRAQIEDLEPKTGYNPEHDDETYDPGMPEDKKPDFFFQTGDYVPTLALLSKRQQRAHELASDNDGALATQIEDLMMGHFDHLDDEKWAQWMRTNKEYQAKYRPSVTQEQPVQDEEFVADPPSTCHDDQPHAWIEIGQFVYRCSVCGDERED